MTYPTFLSTDAVPAIERVPLWQTWMRQRFDGLETDLYGAPCFNGVLQSFAAGPLLLTRLRADAHRVAHSRTTLRRSGRRFLKIVAPLQGRLTVEQAGRCALIEPGQWTIYDTGCEYAITNREAVDHLIVMLPGEHFADHNLRLTDLTTRPVSATTGIGRIAFEAMRSTFAEVGALSSASLQGASDTITYLVFLTLLELAGKETSLTQRASLRSRVNAYIQRHLRDPELSVTSIATAMNCSRRHLYNAFADGTATLASQIWQQRLEACMQELRDPANAGRTLTDIALGWGFTSMSHFSRVFRDHSGLAPSEYRALHEQPDGFGTA